MVSIVHITGIVLTVTLLLAVSWLSGRKVKDAQSFTTGGNSGSWMVCGALLGTLAGGQSTIGTAQLAFCYGVSAWWFTIGAGLGSLILGLLYAGPLRRSGCSTLLEVVSREYGHKAETVGSILFLIGIFISIVSQVLSSSAMITSLFGIHLIWASVVSAVLIMLLVLFGGIRSAGASGIVKLVLLYISSVVAGVVVWHIAGGWTGLRESIDHVYMDNPQLAGLNNLTDIESIHHRMGEKVPAGLGVIDGTALAFPTFVLEHLPAWLGGLLLGTMLINILGCGSGLSLGASTILVRDVYGNLKRRLGMGDSPLSPLTQTRLSIVGILMMAFIVAILFNGSFINDLGFLSLGLRAVAILFPLSFALWCPGRFQARRVLLSMPIGVAAMLLANALSLPGDAVYYGLGASLLTILFPTKR